MFDLAFTPFVIPFMGSLLVSTGLAIYALRRRHVRAAVAFALAMGLLAIGGFIPLGAQTD